MTEFTVLTCIRDEGPALLEWVAYLRLIGVTRIVVYTNDCRDGSDAMLDRLAEMGEGILRRENPVAPGGKPQPAALKAALHDPAVTQTDWLLPIDADEFPAIKTGAGRLPDLIAALPTDTTGVVMTWRIMGSNGIEAWNPGLVTESYSTGARDGFRRGWGVKTMFRPYPDMKLGIHRPTIKGARRDPARRDRLRALRWVNGSGGPLSTPFMDGHWTSTTPTLGYDLVEIAHYAVKSRESYLLRSVRGNVNAKPDKYDATYFTVFDRNETRPDHLTRHLPALRERIAAYRADPVLARLEAGALRWHEDALKALRARPDYADRIEALRRAAALGEGDLDRVLYTRPFGAQAEAFVAKLRAEGLDDGEIAERLNAAIARAEARRDALCAADLKARGL